MAESDQERRLRITRAAIEQFTEIVQNAANRPDELQDIWGILAVAPDGKERVFQDPLGNYCLTAVKPPPVVQEIMQGFIERSGRTMRLVRFTRVTDTTN